MRVTQLLFAIVCFLTIQANATTPDPSNVTAYLNEIVNIGNNISATVNGFVPPMEQSFVTLASAALNVTALAFAELPTAVQSVHEAAGAIENISILAQNNIVQAQSTAKEAADALQEIAYCMSFLRRNFILVAISSFGILAGGVTTGILAARHILIFDKRKNVLYRAFIGVPEQQHLLIN